VTLHIPRQGVKLSRLRIADPATPATSFALISDRTSEL
jgi:hypothetical protein